MLLRSDSDAEVEGAEQRRVHFYCENAAVLYIVGNMVSVSKRVMTDLRVLERLLRMLRIELSSSWLSSAANAHDDRLSRKWYPRDVQVTRQIVESLWGSYQLNSNAAMFPHLLLDLPLVSQRKVVVTALSEDCSVHGVIIYNPLMDMVNVTL